MNIFIYFQSLQIIQHSLKLYVCSSSICQFNVLYIDDTNHPVPSILITFTFTNKVAVVGSLWPSSNRICRYPLKITKHILSYIRNILRYLPGCIERYGIEYWPRSVLLLSLSLTVNRIRHSSGMQIENCIKWFQIGFKPFVNTAEVFCSFWSKQSLINKIIISHYHLPQRTP